MLRLLELEDKDKMSDPKKKFLETGEVETIYPELIDQDGNILDIEYFNEDYDKRENEERDRFAMLDEDY